LLSIGLTESKSHIIQNQYNVGDIIKAAAVVGLVEAVDLRSSSLTDPVGILIIVPDGEIRVTCDFTKILSTVHLNINIAYKEELARVVSIISKTRD
jgi:small-conductance mechanosensitive channel